jgi:hypothetical protein
MLHRNRKEEEAVIIVQRNWERKIKQWIEKNIDKKDFECWLPNKIDWFKKSFGETIKDYMKKKAKPEEIRMQDQNIRQGLMMIIEPAKLMNVTYEEDIKKPIENKNITEEMIGFRIDKRTLGQLVESSKQYEVNEMKENKKK